MAVQNDSSREFTTTERKKLAGKGAAMKDGSYPIATRQDLRNAIQAYGRSKNKAATKRHIIKRARALGLVDILPKEWNVKTIEKAHDESGRLLCTEEGCGRAFLDQAALYDHAEAVHTFDDIRRAVQDALRDTFGRKSNYKAKPPVEGIYVWIADLAEDWLVFEREAKGSDLWKVFYTRDAENKVTFGEPTQVARRTVYEAVKDGIKYPKP